MGEQLDLNEVMELHTERLLRVAFYYTKNIQTAEDIVQDVFIKFYEVYEHYEERGELQAYLTRMTINKCKDYLRSWPYRKLQFLQKWTTANQTDLLHNKIAKDEKAFLHEQILQLPIMNREVIVYYYFEEMSLAEIAVLLNIPLSTVKTRMTRSRSLLKQKLSMCEWEGLYDE